MTKKAVWAGSLYIISLIFLLTAPAIAQNNTLTELQNTSITEDALNEGIIIDEETHSIKGSVTEPANTSPAKARDVARTGNWRYISDEAYLDFPHTYITIVKRVPLEDQNCLSNDKVSLVHRRHSLASRSGAFSASKYVRKRVQQDMSPVILKYAKLYQVSPYIIKAVIEVESSFNPNALSCSGACGLMQLKPGTAYDMGVSNYWHPEKNIEAGTKYLRLMIDMFGSLGTALAAYNQGPGAVQRAGGVAPNYSATHYTRKVLNALEASK